MDKQGRECLIMATVTSGTVKMDYSSIRDEDEVINAGTDAELLCRGYRSSFSGKFLYNVLAILTVGTSLLFFHWKPALRVKLRKTRCSIANADTLLLENKFHEVFVVSIAVQQVSSSFPPEYRFSCMSSGYGSFDVTSNGNHFTSNQEGLVFKYFIHQHVKYIWDNRRQKYSKLRGYDSGSHCKDLLENFHGLEDNERNEKQILYGDNSIDIEVKSYAKLLFEEMMHPFYIFQVFSIILWFADEYYAFSGCIIVITSVSLAVSLYEIKKQSLILHNMVSSLNDVHVTVLQCDGQTKIVPAKMLVPGDLIVIPSNGCIMTCDAILIGGSCIVNESMLTGESVPVMKTQLPLQDDNEIYCPDTHKRHTLFCGTHVLQTRYYGDTKVTALVIRTGFATTKGELVRSILFPRPLGFKFYRDSMHFVGVLFGIAVLGIAYSMYIFIQAKYPTGRLIIRILDIVTIVVPPSLPAAMTVGSVYAQDRLKKKGVFCISPPRINVSGKLKLFCFDKTGTLTEDGLDLWAVVPVKDRKFDLPVTNPKLLDEKSLLVASMATCHALTNIEGELKGDPLDLKMFEATNWVLEEPGEEHTRYDTLCPVVVRPIESHSDLKLEDTQDSYQIGILRQFTFSSTLQRMSVVTRTLGKQQMDVFVKGAPEKIVTLCHPETVPDNFYDQLQMYAVQGYRVIAVAWRSLSRKMTWHQVQKAKRDDIETDLTFLGLLVLQNMLKPETTPVISILNNARIRSVMITGDNMHTAISVARECGMVNVADKVIVVTALSSDSNQTDAVLQMQIAENDTRIYGNNVTELSINDDSFVIDVDTSNYHFCMNGKTFSLVSQHFPELLLKFVVRGTIFARMSPDQKSQLVKLYQKLGYTVGMCGDGANDCGALKAADVGISLSEAEASVAAPFTSKIPNIECVPTLIKEGRCALATSFGVFKYMALYSIIQFISVLILYTFKTNLGDYQFLYVDLGLATIMAIVMSYTKSFDFIVAERPQGRLISFPVMLSLFAQIILAGFVQVGAILLLQRQSWYVETKGNPDGEFVKCWETSVTFCVANFQYVITAVVFSKGPPFRKPSYTNVWMVLSVVLFTFLNVIFIIYPIGWVETIFELMLKDKHSAAIHRRQFNFRIWLLDIVLVNIILSGVIEVLANSSTLKKCYRCLKRKKVKDGNYKTIEKEISFDKSWPVINQQIRSCQPL